MKRKITGTLLALLISGSSIAASASTVMGISSEYLPEIEEAVENEDPEDGGSETESIQQEQNVVSDTEETLAQGDSETEISENKQSGNFSENDKKTAEIFSEEEQQSGEEADFAVFSEENADLLTGNSEEAQELIQDIENGEMIAFSPALAESFTQTESAQVTADDNETLAVLRWVLLSTTWMSGQEFTVMKSGQLQMISGDPETRPAWAALIDPYTM